MMHSIFVRLRACLWIVQKLLSSSTPCACRAKRRRRRGREDAAFVSVRWCRWLCHRPVVVAADRSPLTPTPIDGARARSFADALLLYRTTDPFSPLLVSVRHQPEERRRSRGCRRTGILFSSLTKGTFNECFSFYYYIYNSKILKVAYQSTNARTLNRSTSGTASS
jgi:hypothetical protein